MNIVKQDLLHKKQFFENFMKGEFQLMLILVLLGMYFDAVVVFVTNQTLLFRLALLVKPSLDNQVRNFDSYLFLFQA